MRRALFLVVNAGQGPSGDWPLQQTGPDGATALWALEAAASDASARAGYDYFSLLMANWKNELVRWRCGLSPEELKRIAAQTGNWNCHDLEMFVGELSFADAGPERESILRAVPTRFQLPAETVDFLIESGRIAVRNEVAVRDLLKSLRRTALPTTSR